MQLLATYHDPLDSKPSLKNDQTHYTSYCSGLGGLTYSQGTWAGSLNLHIHTTHLSLVDLSFGFITQLLFLVCFALFVKLTLGSPPVLLVFLVLLDIIRLWTFLEAWLNLSAFKNMRWNGFSLFLLADLTSPYTTRGSDRNPENDCGFCWLHIEVNLRKSVWAVFKRVWALSLCLMCKGHHITFNNLSPQLKTGIKRQ